MTSVERPFHHLYPFAAPATYPSQILIQLPQVYYGPYLLVPLYNHDPGHQVAQHPPDHQSSSNIITKGRFPTTQLLHPPKLYQYSSKTARIDIRHLDDLLKQAPLIPPVDLSRGNRSLEQSLLSQIENNRNVFIYGLRADTEKETFLAYVNRFGSIESCEPIIESSTGTCKGFGFVKYYDANHAELCIRGLYILGYVVSFAKRSITTKARGNKILSYVTPSGTLSNSTGVGLSCSPICATTPASKDFNHTTGVRRHPRDKKRSAFTSPNHCAEFAHPSTPSPISSYQKGNNSRRSTSSRGSATSPASSRARDSKASNSTSEVLDDGEGGSGAVCSFNTPIVVCSTEHIK